MRRKPNASAESTIEEESIDSSPLSLSTVSATPMCSTVSTPRIPTTPGLLGEVLSRRRSTPTTNRGARTPSTTLTQPPAVTTNSIAVPDDATFDTTSQGGLTPPKNTPVPLASPSIDILDDINTQTLNDLLAGETNTTPSQQQESTPKSNTTQTTSPLRSPTTDSPFATPLGAPEAEKELSSQLVGTTHEAATPSEADPAATVKLLVKPVLADADDGSTRDQNRDDNSQDAQPGLPEKSPRKRKATTTKSD